YAFGVILYEALTGRVPFNADSYSALVLAIANSKPRPVRELKPEVPANLERVVAKAMEKDCAARYQSMDALIAALAPFASIRSGGGWGRAGVGRPGAARPPRGGGPPGVPFSGGRPVAAGGGGGVWAHKGARPPRHRRRDTAARGHPRRSDDADRTLRGATLRGA